MNAHLRKEIVKHVFANLGIISSDFVSRKLSKSLMDDEFLLRTTLIFEDENGGAIRNKVWGCQISADVQEIKILLGACSEYKDIAEFAVIVQLKNAPAYGVYLVCNDKVDSEALISCTINQKDWMECGTYLQATFLAGMEQIRDIGLSWNKCTDYESQYQLMLSFIKYHRSVYGDNNEG